ncbi:hypothetical protein [Streptomyces anulatus]|uniref:hypothetical protein n=1 Tax=Streptomyces anulatus TaxID=1892 RepID=UPI0036903DEB
MVGIEAAVQWAAPAAQALIAAMATDMWSTTRDRVARLLSRRPEAADEVTEELDEARQLVIDGGTSDEAREAASAEWAARFRRALNRDPALLDQLRHLLAEHGLEETESGTGFTQNVSATDGGIVFNQGSGTQTNNVQRS